MPSLELLLLLNGLGHDDLAISNYLEQTTLLQHFDSLFHVSDLLELILDCLWKALGRLLVGLLAELELHLIVPLHLELNLPQPCFFLLLLLLDLLLGSPSFSACLHQLVTVAFHDYM